MPSSISPFLPFRSEKVDPMRYLRPLVLVLILGAILCGSISCGNGTGTSSTIQGFGSSTPTPLAFVTTTLPDGVVNNSYSATIAVIGGTAPYTFKVSAGSLPSGLQLVASTGILSGALVQAGTSNFSIQVTDSSSPAQTATQAFTYTVDATALPLVFVNKSLSSASLNQAYATTINANGGIAPYTFSLSAGTLPPGMQFFTPTSTQAAIAGTPTQAGTFTFTIKVVDSSSSAQTLSQQFTLVVVAPLAISTTSLPGGQVGVTYSVPIGVIGGTTPYAFGISSG